VVPPSESAAHSSILSAPPFIALFVVVKSVVAISIMYFIGVFIIGSKSLQAYRFS
jgi:hypothetical protein